MKIFGYNFSKATPPTTTITSNGPKGQSFSTPFTPIGGGNLSLPYIDKRWLIDGQWVAFSVGECEFNMYPQILNRLYFTSGIHADAVDTTVNAVIGGGYEFTIPPATGVESVELFTFEKANKIKRLVKELTMDYVIHRRICVIISRDEQGKFKRMRRVDPETIRHAWDLKKFGFCYDWRTRIDGVVTYNRYNPISKDTESLYLYQNNVGGQDIYPLPRYNSILNWLFFDGEQAYLQKENIQNSIYPSVIYSIPYLMADDEAAAFKKSVQHNKGAKGTGNAQVLQADGAENVPTITTIQTNQNDKLFDSTDKIMTDKICQAHMINPGIMGIKVAGSLGNAQELQMSYSIFEKLVVMPLRAEMEEVFEELFDIAGIQNSIKFKNFQIIDGTIEQAPATDGTITLSDEYKKNNKA